MGRTTQIGVTQSGFWWHKAKVSSLGLVYLVHATLTCRWTPKHLPAYVLSATVVSTCPVSDQFCPDQLRLTFAPLGSFNTCSVIQHPLGDSTALAGYLDNLRDQADKLGKVLEKSVSNIDTTAPHDTEIHHWRKNWPTWGEIQPLAPRPSLWTSDASKLARHNIQD